MKRLLLIVLLLASTAWAEPVARVATFADYEPFGFYAPGADRAQHREQIPPGQPSQLFTGLAWEVVLESFHRAGYRVELQIVPWPRAVRLLDEGKIDAVFPAIQTDERRQRYRFSRQLVYPENRLLIYLSASTAQASSLATDPDLSQLEALSVGMIRGFSYGPTWDRHSAGRAHKPVLLNDIRQGFELLESGRLDALVGYELSHDYHLRRLGKAGLFAKSAPLDQARSFLMGRGDAHLVMDALDRGRAALAADGGYQRLLEKWDMD